MKSARRAGLAALALALALGAGCGARREAAVDAAAPIRIGVFAEPPHLNPLLLADAVIDQIALGDVYEPLFTVSPSGSLVPVLAASARLSADGTQLDVVVRDGVRWHDGRPLTAHDVAYTLRLLGPGGAPSVLASDFDDLVAVDELPGGAVRARFAGFRLGRDRTLALVPVLPAHVFEATPPARLLEHPASRAPVGTGPLRFASWTAGRELRLVRADTFAGPAALAAEVVYRFVPDRTRAVAELVSGELDVLLGVPPPPVGTPLTTSRAVQIMPTTAASYLAARWNCRVPALADARVRRALTMLLDRTAVARELLGGRGVLAATPWLPGDVAVPAALVAWPFDVDAARALLAEADARDLRVRLLVPAGSATLGRVATLWQADAARAGVTLEFVSDPDPIARARSGDFDAVLYAWSTSPEQDLSHQFAGPPLGTDNLGACVDAELDMLFAQIRATPAAAARAALEHRAAARLHALEFVTVIAHDVRTIAVRARGLREFSIDAESGRVPAARLARQPR